MLALAVALAAASPPAVTIRDLVEIADISSLALSPDGRHLAFRTELPSIEKNRIETRWYVLPLHNGQPPRLLADGGEAFTTGAGVVPNEPPTWMHDGSAILFRAAIKGEVQVWSADVTSGRARPVTHDPGDVRQFSLTSDGMAIRYSTGAARAAIAAEETRLREIGGRVDPSVDLTIGLVGGARRFGKPHSVRLLSHWFQRRDLLDDGPERVLVQSLNGGQPTLALDKALEKIPGADLKGAKERLCKQINCKAQALRVEAIVPATALGGTLITTTDRAQQQSLWLVKAKGLKRLVTATGLLSGSRDSADPCAISGRIALCVETAADIPPRLVRIDLERGRVKPLFSPNADLQARSANTSRLLRWSDLDGHQFTGQLLLPRLPKPAAGFPLVLHYYWCDGYLRGGTGDELPMRPLLTVGVASLCVNWSSVHRPKQDSVADYRVAQSGLNLIVERLAKEGLVDRTKIGMQGLSFGSEVTMWMATKTPLLAAAALATGQLEPTTYWFQIGKGRDTAEVMQSVWGLGDPDKTPDDWQRLSAARHFKLMQTPLLMQLPESEARWSIELSAKLARSSTPFELYVFPNATHIKFEPRHKLAAYERNLAWFAFWLAGRTVRDPDDPGRLERWRSMAAAWQLAKAR